MTGGVAVVIGATGRNFAAGMSGGVAFVLDEDGEFRQRCNLEMVDLEPLCEPDDIELVRDLLIQHAGYTGSAVAKRLLKDWKRAIKEFVKVMPLDYRRVLEERKTAALADPATEPLAERWRWAVGKPTGFIEIPREMPTRRPV